MITETTSFSERKHSRYFNARHSSQVPPFWINVIILVMLTGGISYAEDNQWWRQVVQTPYPDPYNRRPNDTVVTQRPFPDAMGNPVYLIKERQCGAKGVRSMSENMSSVCNK